MLVWNCLQNAITFILRQKGEGNWSLGYLLSQQTSYHRFSNYSSASIYTVAYRYPGICDLQLQWFFAGNSLGSRPFCIRCSFYWGLRDGSEGGATGWKTCQFLGDVSPLSWHRGWGSGVESSSSLDACEETDNLYRLQLLKSSTRGKGEAKGGQDRLNPEILKISLRCLWGHCCSACTLPH